MKAMMTVVQRKLLLAIGRGVDVWGYRDATMLREMSRMRPALVKIVKARRAPRNGAMAQPYFGCKPTAHALRLLRLEAR